MTITVCLISALLMWLLLAPVTRPAVETMNSKQHLARLRPVYHGPSHINRR